MDIREVVFIIFIVHNFCHEVTELSWSIYKRTKWFLSKIIFDMSIGFETQQQQYNLIRAVPFVDRRPQRHIAVFVLLIGIGFSFQ